MPSKAVIDKAKNLLTTGGVKIQQLNASTGLLLAFVRTSSGGDPYHVKHNFGEDLGWSCDCPARVNLCAHILAVGICTPLAPPHDD